MNHFKPLSRREYINGLVGRDIVTERGIPKIRGAIDRIFRHFRTKELFEQCGTYETIGFMMDSFTLNVDLGNYCEHMCQHCLIEGNPNGYKMDLEDFSCMLAKYHTKLRFLRHVFFMGGELLDRDDFHLFIEELLKRGVNDIHFVSRGSIRNDSYDFIRKIIALKEKYPGFKLGIILSIDSYSPAYQENPEAYIKNISELSVLLFEYFGNDSVTYRFSIPSMDQEELEKHLDYGKLLINEIIFELKDFDYRFIRQDHHKEKGESLCVENVHLSRNKKIQVRYNRVSNHSPRSDDLKGLLPKGGSCKIFHDDPFSINVDPFFNIRECISHHGDNPQNRKMLNLMKTKKRDALKILFRNKMEFYGNVTYEELVDYILDHRGKYLCK